MTDYDNNRNNTTINTASLSKETDEPESSSMFSVSHAKDAIWSDGGLRSYFEYRDLGIRDATRGQFGAHVIRAKDKGESRWHSHGLLQFQVW